MSDDNTNSVAAFARMDRAGDTVICICNFTPVARQDYRIGVPERGVLTVLLDSEAAPFGGTHTGKPQRICTKREPMHGKDHSFALDLPGFSCTYLRFTKYKTKK